MPPGHFYSPITDAKEIERRSASIFDRSRRELAGIDVREKEQLALLGELAVFYKDMPFPREKTEGSRYYLQNDAYSYSDAILLHGMIRHLRPARIVELVADAGARLDVRARALEDLDLALFSELGERDILFIDSTHVTKTGSDVNRIFFEILPRLAAGVHVHFHDVFWPFEYPREWVLEGRSWNESYLLRAFLQFNSRFEIVLWNTFLETFHEEIFAREMPLCLENKGGSIWLRKTGDLERDP
ncbi:class I SAM-dependent methyltransferase [bacterium]|nr:class I SAM-dependent methyltransferase [bacterium]